MNTIRFIRALGWTLDDILDAVGYPMTCIALLISLLALADMVS